MESIKQISLLFLFSLLLTGCTFVKTKTTVFHGDNHLDRGTVTVLALEPELNNSLEFKTYKRVLEDSLSDVGYTPVNEPNNADYIAFVSYGIGDGQTTVSSIPIYGKTGGGSTYSTGTVTTNYGTMANYSGYSYTAPTYGVVNSVTVKKTNYTRTVALDILDGDALRNNNVRKKYEIKAQSTGKCSQISPVFNKMVEAMFLDFPGESGKTRTKTLDATGLDC